MKRLIVAAALSATPAVAAPAPVYLSCTIQNGSPLTLTVDEGNSIVTVMVERTPRPQRMPAAFTAGTVTFASGGISYTVDRRTLGLVRKVSGMGWVDSGTCKIEKVQNRAF